MSHQRYRPGSVAHDRMAAGTCPECGHAPGDHHVMATVTAMFSPCGLLVRGVEDRIAQYRADCAEAAAIEAEGGTPMLIEGYADGTSTATPWRIP